VAALIKASGSSTSTTNYGWNAYGELCNVSAAAVTACGATPSTGDSYTYNGDGLRMSTVAATSGTTTSTVDSSWDAVTEAVPLNVNDATTTSGGTSNTSYLYGDLLLGGTAPIEQITTTSSGSTALFLVANQTGVQGVYSSAGANVEMALYSNFGIQTIESGTKVTPFGFQGSYSDSTGLVYLINRYYDPTTDEFLSIDPDVATTDQPYVFTNDDPLNSSDPTGLWPGEGLLHKGLDVLAVVPYAVYFVAYQTGRGINAVGCHFGSIGCAASKSLVLMTGIPEAQIVGLFGDVVIDAVKGKTVNHESIFDENIKGGILPRFIDGGGPKIELPGISKTKQGKIIIKIEW
jgi:RHS repeat-associated protein